LATRTPVSDEEIQLRKRARRRLVGAIALVVLVVAAVPMLLDSEPKARTERIEVQIPPIPTSPDTSAAAAAPAQPPVAASAAPSTDSEPPPPAARPATETPPPQPVSPAPVPPSTPIAAGAAPSAAPQTPGPASKPASASAKDGYVVQLIATTSPAKARELRQKLERLKFPAYTEKTRDGGKTRVRVGPFETREAAEQARQRLVKLDYDPGKVVRKGN
jgi:DedD protein